MPLRLLQDMDMHYQEESVRNKSDANLHSDSGDRLDALLPEKKYPDYCKTLTYTDASGHVKELVLPKALDLDRPKRARTTFSPEQLYQLETEFGRNQYLVGRERSKLAQRLQLSETQVKVWFQNRRTKCKRDKGRDHDSPLPLNNSHTSSQTSMSFLGQQSPTRRPDKGLQLTGPLRYPPPPPQATSLGFAPPLSLPGMYGVNISDLPYVPSFAGRPYGALPPRMCAINSPLSAMTSPAGPSATSLDEIVTSRTGAMTTYSPDAAKCTQSRDMARNSYLMASSVHSKS